MRERLANQGPRPNFLTIFRDESDDSDLYNRFITAPDAFKIISEIT